MNMKALGIVRNMDQLGRVVIPSEIRNVINWGPKTPIEMLSTNDGLLIREYRPQCMVCGETAAVEKKGVRLCRKCARELTEMCV